jgi:hypothetical protein
VISCLLVAVAFGMGRDARQLLIGSAALPEEREALERAIEEFDEVDAVKELLTMVLGPNALPVSRPGGTPQGKMSQSSCLANEVGEQSVHPLGPMDASL